MRTSDLPLHVHALQHLALSSQYETQDKRVNNQTTEKRCCGLLFATGSDKKDTCKRFSSTQGKINSFSPPSDSCAPRHNSKAAFDLSSILNPRDHDPITFSHVCSNVLSHHHDVIVAAPQFSLLSDVVDTYQKRLFGARALRSAPPPPRINRNVMSRPADKADRSRRVRDSRGGRALAIGGSANAGPGQVKTRPPYSVKRSHKFPCI